MLVRSPLHGAATIYLKSQIHVDDVVDTKRNSFSLRLWEWEVNGKEFHLLRYLQNYFGSSYLKDSPPSRAHSSHLLSLPHPSLRVKLMNPERDPLKLNRTEHCSHHLRVICSHEAYGMQNHVKGDTIHQLSTEKAI